MRTVSFVSVPQQFNTTTRWAGSRSTCLPFAQFEREVTAERMATRSRLQEEAWMGVCAAGWVGDRKLLIDEGGSDSALAV